MTSKYFCSVSSSWYFLREGEMEGGGINRGRGLCIQPPHILFNLFQFLIMLWRVKRGRLIYIEPLKSGRFYQFEMNEEYS